MPDYVTPSGPEKPSTSGWRRACSLPWPCSAPPSGPGTGNLAGCIRHRATRACWACCCRGGRALRAAGAAAKRHAISCQVGADALQVNFEYTLIALYVLAGAGSCCACATPANPASSGWRWLFTMAMSEYSSRSTPMSTMCTTSRATLQSVGLWLSIPWPVRRDGAKALPGSAGLRGGPARHAQHPAGHAVQWTVRACTWRLVRPGRKSTGGTPSDLIGRRLDTVLPPAGGRPMYGRAGRGRAPGHQPWQPHHA